MRNLKKFFALALSLVMMVSVMVPAAFADDPTTDTYTLTINNNQDDHTYQAYQIFAGTLNESTLSNITWGSGIAAGQGDALITALLNDEEAFTITKMVAGVATPVSSTLKEEFAALIADPNNSITEINSASTLAAAIAALQLADNSMLLDRIAEIIGTYDYVNGVHTYLSTTFTTSDHVNGSGKYTFTLPAGYYLVKDEEGTQNGEYDFYTRYIVTVVKTTAMNVKGDTVKIDKTISDQLNTNFTEVKDFDIADIAYYRLVGTLPSDYARYDNYYYKFVDTLPAGLDFARIESIYVKNDTTDDIVHTFYTAPDLGDAKPTAAAPFATEDFEGMSGVNVTLRADGQTVEVEFEDLKTWYGALHPGLDVVVKYSAVVNKDIVISEAIANGTVKPIPNTNKAYVEFSNNPNGDGHGKTEDDEAHAFSFNLVIDKYDKDNHEVKLQNVEFILYYEKTDDNGTPDVTTDDVLVNYYAQFDSAGKLTGYTTDATQASKIVTDANGNFTVSGLDAGVYFIRETKAADGYNLMDTRVKVTITPNYVINNGVYVQDDSSVTYKVDDQNDDGIVGISNAKGSTLPSTGGIGTTIFYVAGGAMVVAALVLIITKKRMNADN